MNRQSGRRRVRKRKAPAQKTRVKFTVFLGIMILAVFAGYLTARFVLGPFIGYNVDESPAKIADEESEPEEGAQKEDVQKEEEVFQDMPSEGYALQFGVFSTAEGAEQLRKALEEQGIRTEIVKTEDLYKVISPVADTKEKVLSELESLKGKQVEDVFVTSFG